MKFNKEHNETRKQIKLEEKILKERRKISNLPLIKQKLALEKLNEKYQINIPKKEVEKIIKDDKIDKTTHNIKKELTERELETLKIREKIKSAQGLIFKTNFRLEKDYNIKDDDNEDNDNNDSSYNITSSFLSFKHFKFIPIIIGIAAIIFGFSLIIKKNVMIILFFILPLIIFISLQRRHNIMPTIMGLVGIGIVIFIGFAVINNINEVLEENNMNTSSEMIDIQKILPTTFSIFAFGIIVISAFGLIRVFGDY